MALRQPLRTQAISIHTLRVEGDVIALAEKVTGLAISIHTLRVEGDGDDLRRHMLLKLFQSTPSAWRVTWPLSCGSQQVAFQSHTLRVEGDSKSAQKSRTLLFKVTDLRRNCRPDVHKRTEGSL